MYEERSVGSSNRIDRAPKLSDIDDRGNDFYRTCGPPRATNSRTTAPSMTNLGSDIAFWEILNDGVLNSRLDSLLGRLGFSGVGLKYTTPVLSCCLFLVFISICFLAFLRPRKEDHMHTRAALQALLTVVVPTCSLWPGRYIELASVLRSRVDIPLEVIIEDTIDGVIEFCNPIDDLAGLIGTGTTVNGHTICINIGWRWWISCFQWWMLAKVRPTYHLPDIRVTHPGGHRSDSPSQVCIRDSSVLLSVAPTTSRLFIVTFSRIYVRTV